MTRLPRLNLPGIPQHVIQHGNNRHVCFYTEPVFFKLVPRHINFDRLALPQSQLQTG